MADEDYDSIVVTDTGGISKKAGSFSSWPTELSERKWQIERSNLLNIAKICVKTLIESSLSAKTGRVLTDDFSPLLHFFVIIEHILRHGMKAKRSLLGGRKEFISVLEILENKIPLLQDILLNIKNLSNVKTNLGRTRAWIRFALMQKVFAEQLSRIVEERPILSEWYEDYSMILSDEMLVISGLLVGLNVIDCNFDLKSTDLDTQNSVIDISIYLRDGNYLEKSVDKNGLDATEGPKLDVILDQKAYLEQINKTLNDSNTILKQQVKDFIERETVISKEVDLLKNQLLASIAERDKYKYDYEKLLLDHNQTIKIVTSDFDVERETHQQSRAGLNEMYLKVQADLDRVTLEKKELEIMMDDHIAMNKEKMLAMELLEKDINDKQEIITSLRRQLEDIKKINLEMHKKWQASETLLKKNESEYASLEIKLANSISQVKELEKNLAETEQIKKQEEEKALNNNAKFQNERQILQTDLKIEREWRIGLQSEIENNIKKLQKLEYELNQLTETVKENESMKKKLLESEKTCADLETALEEMGKKLNMSHSQVDEMRELQIAMKDKLWQEDKDTNECQLCIQQFSLSKRKHHCRNCGGIFCHSCSDNTLALKSSAKPVRVCDTCYEALLSRCTPKPN